MVSLLLPVIYLAFISLARFPLSLLVLRVRMVVMHEQLTRRTACR